MKRSPVSGIVVAQALTIIFLLFINFLNRDRAETCRVNYQELLDARLEDLDRHVKDLDKLTKEIEKLAQTGP